MNFAYPNLLYLLLLVPIIGILHIISRKTRRKRLQRFGNLATLSSLMPDASRYLPGIKMLIELFALTLIIIAAARPYVKTQGNVNMDSVETSTVSGIEVMICCDVSNSMLASSTTDPHGTSRLQRAKFLIEKMLSNMSDDRIGLIAFAGNAYTQLPITPDIYAAKMLSRDLSTKIAPTQGTAIGAAIDMAMSSFDPESQFRKVIIVITDGENFEDDAIAAAKRANDAGVQVNVIGIGTSTAMPVPLTAENNGEFMTYNGEKVMSALDEDGAANIATAGGGIYIAGSATSAVNDLKTQLNKIAKTEYTRTAIPTDSSDLFPLFIGVALLLLLIDIALPYKKLVWLKNITFFSRD